MSRVATAARTPAPRRRWTDAAPNATAMKTCGAGQQQHDVVRAAAGVARERHLNPGDCGADQGCGQHTYLAFPAPPAPKPQEKNQRTHPGIALQAAARAARGGVQPYHRLLRHRAGRQRLGNFVVFAHQPAEQGITLEAVLRLARLAPQIVRRPTRVGTKRFPAVLRIQIVQKEG